MPRTPATPGICSLLFSFLLFVKVASSVGGQMGLVLHLLLFGIKLKGLRTSSAVLGQLWILFIFLFRLAHVAGIDLATPIPMDVKPLSCVMLHVVLLLLTKYFILDLSW